MAIASDSAPVAECEVEGLAERNRRVLGGVMVAGLPVAAAVDEQVEAAMERELLEQVVVETGAGGDAYASGAVETEPHAQGRLRRRANVPDAAPLRLLARRRARRAAGRCPHGRAR